MTPMTQTKQSPQTWARQVDHVAICVVIMKSPHQLSCDQAAAADLVKDCVAILKVMLPILDAVS